MHGVIQIQLFQMNPKKDEPKIIIHLQNQNSKANGKVEVSSIRLSGISKQIAAGKKLTTKAVVLPDNVSNKILSEVPAIQRLQP